MGRCIVAGGKPDMAAPSAGILASDLAVGSIVKLMEGGVATEYLVVNQGKPSGSSLYDDSCDGLWLLRKDIKEQRQWHSSNVNDYENSTINAWLNGDLFNQFGSVEQLAIKRVKIPYRKGSGYNTDITSGSNGLEVMVFLLSGAEVNWSSNISAVIPNDGNCLSYFSGTSKLDSKRIAYRDSGQSANWWLRDPYCLSSEGSTLALIVGYNGGYTNGICMYSQDVRPAVIIKHTAVFDETTMLLKGVA